MSANWTLANSAVRVRVSGLSGLRSGGRHCDTCLE